MTDFAPIRSPRPRSMSRLQALALAVVLILGGVAIARADRPAEDVAVTEAVVGY